MVIEDFSTMRDDLIIRGKFYSNEPDKMLPAVILSHGFTGTYKRMEGYAKYIAMLGYHSFAFDFSGGSKDSSSDGNTYDMSIFTQKKDLDAVIDYVKALPYVDKDRIILFGASQGGIVSLMAASDRSDDIERLILLYPALCIPDDARRGQIMFTSFDPDSVPERLVCGPIELGSVYITSVLKMDPYAELTGYKKNITVIHGTDDQIVKIEYSRRLKEVYPEMKLYEIKGAGHGFSEKDIIKAKHFIRKNLR